MQISVLHISDLHCDPDSPLSNSMLLDSLVRDRERYTVGVTPVEPPDVIIASGDIVQGVRHDVANAEQILSRQYDKALDLLDQIANEFVGGNKERVIIVPGNHDVSDTHFHKTLVPVSPEQSSANQLFQELSNPSSPYRWSWREGTWYKIEDQEGYHNRLAPFVDFYDSFYEGQRSYSPDPHKQLDFFDFPEWEVTVVGFSSCYNNDLLRRQGTINPECIARAGEGLRENTREGWLRFAVWHHNIEGPPHQVDYMDPAVVQVLIDSGFSLAFHGHQHKPQFLDTRFRYGVNRHLTVVSAGTIAGSPAYGFGRTYNIVQLDTETRTGHLHIREMQQDNLEMPIWVPRYIQQDSFNLEFEFDAAPPPSVNPRHNTRLLSNAERLFDEGSFRKAADVLLPIIYSDQLARRILLECLLELEDSEKIIQVFDPPMGPAEAIVLMDSLWEAGEKQHLAEVLEYPIIRDSSDEAVTEIKLKHSARV